ncbi:hypothetical protein C0J52_04176, partial [Blattella germanica]
SEQLQINDSVLSIVVKLLPSLISPRKINLEHVKMVQTKLFKAGYKLQDLMLQVLFHDPLDYPETSLQTAVVEPQMMVTIGLGAQAIESAPEVRTLNVAQRQCWFDDEVSLLNASPEYSYQTCITECRMEVLNSKCGCTPFFYPMFSKRRIPNASVLHVHFSEFTCMKYARNAYMTWDSVFATFGGIFGLCMGGSVISLFELGYRFLLMLGAGCKAMLRSKPPKARENIVLPWSMEPEKHHLKLFHTKSSSKLCNFNKNSGF